MSDSFIQVQGTGQKINTKLVNTGVGAVESQVGVLGDPDNGALHAKIGQNPMAQGLNVAIASDQTPVPVVQRTEVAGGLSTFHLVGLATTNPTIIKNSPGAIYGIIISNINGVERKVAFHNTNLAPVAGSTPIKFSVVVPGNTCVVVPIGNLGIPFSAGIALTTVTGIADTSAAAIGANQVSIEVMYV